MKKCFIFLFFVLSGCGRGASTTIHLSSIQSGQESGTSASDSSQSLTTSLTQITSVPSSSKSNDQKIWYGYFASAITAVNYTREVSRHTNTVWINAIGPNDLADLRSKLETAKQMKVNAIIHVAPYFFQSVNDRPTLAFRNDSSARWNAAAKIISQYEKQIAAFLVFDEPNFVNSIGTQFAPRKVANILNETVSRVKAKFNKPTLVDFSYYETQDNKDFIVPEAADWLGINCYGKFDSCGVDRPGGPLSIPEYYRILSKRLRNNQRLVLFPKTMRIDATHEWSLSEEEISSDLEKYYQLMVKDSRVVGFFPYLWQSYQEGPFLVRGANELPKVKSKLIEIGNRLFRIRGNIDGIGHRLGGSVTVEGWACVTGLDMPIAVDLYVAGEAGKGGKMISRTLSNFGSELAVSTQCKGAGRTYRFAIPLTSQVRARFAGQPIFVYGISPYSDLTNSMIPYSGYSYVPR